MPDVNLSAVLYKTGDLRLVITHLVWPHQPGNPLGRLRSRRIGPWRNPSLFPLFYSTTP